MTELSDIRNKIFTELRRQTEVYAKLEPEVKEALAMTEHIERRVSAGNRYLQRPQRVAPTGFKDFSQTSIKRNIQLWVTALEILVVILVFIAYCWMRMGG